MDPVPILFYAVICSALSVLVPGHLRTMGRALIGAGVGIAAAIALPVVRGAFGV